MRELQALVAAAGPGTRANLSYPKTLFSVRGKPILVHALSLMKCLDVAPTVIVSPSGVEPISQCISRHGLNAHLVVQPSPGGMGDAVLHLASSTAEPAEHVLLLWGDIPFVQQCTLDSMLRHHFQVGADFTFVTAAAAAAYTVVRRDAERRVLGVQETRETGITLPGPGERDMGLFVFRREPVMRLLAEALPDRLGRRTGEHGFLYVIGHLTSRGFKVEALPIATPLDLISLNAIDDVQEYV